MTFRIFTLILTMLVACNILNAQDESVESFHAIKLETSSDPGTGITLSAPNGVAEYSLIFPATTAPNATRRYAFSLNAGDNALSWYQTPFGTPGQVPYFETTEELTGSPNFLWDNTTQTLTLNSTSNVSMLKLVKDADVTADETIIGIDATYKSTGGNDVAVSLIDFNFDGSSLANGSTVSGLDINIVHSSSNTVNPSIATGLRIDVSGADTNRAAILMGGFVGINTEYPEVYLDITGDVAYNEFNFMGNMSTTMDAVDFDGEGNRHSFIRIGTQLTSTITIKGLKGGYDGKMMKIYNASGKTIKIANKAAADSVNNIKTTGGDLLFLDGNVYELMYSGIEKNWLVAFSGPGEISTLGNEDVGPVDADDYVLPSSTASYIQVTTSGANGSKYDVILEDGTSPGQLLVVQNLGPHVIQFTGTNVILDNADTDLNDNESIIFIWNGSDWVQVARASN